ncbi:MAG: KH domain-containing protein [Polyangiaceae bacterium]|nr:KH domain-containing protein [Polyangiaceae bacterium]
MKELIATMARELVERPEEVSVTEIASDSQILYELRVAKTDIGKVIGRDGRTAQSMRTILTAVASKTGKKTHLEIVE